MSPRLPLLARVVGLATTLGLAAFLGGCGPEYDHTEITASRASALGGSVDRTLVLVPEGMIVTAHIVPYDDDRKMMALAVRSLDESIVEAAPIISDNDWAFIGNKQGETDVQVIADDRVVLVITARVIPQPVR